MKHKQQIIEWVNNGTFIIDAKNNEIHCCTVEDFDCNTCTTPYGEVHPGFVHCNININDFKELFPEEFI